MKCEKCNRETVRWHAVDGAKVCPACAGMRKDGRPKARRLIAMALGLDIADVEPYQYGKTKVAVYQAGGAQWVCMPQDKYPPKGFDWKPWGAANWLKEKYKVQVFVVWDK